MDMYIIISNEIEFIKLIKNFSRKSNLDLN